MALGRQRCVIKLVIGPSAMWGFRIADEDDCGSLCTEGKNVELVGSKLCHYFYMSISQYLEICEAETTSSD